MAAPTINAKLQQNSTKERPPPEIIVFNNPDKRKRNIKKEGKKSTVWNKKTEEEYQLKKHNASLKMAKFEVRKFGINGFSKEKKEDAKVRIAIELGARPLKRKAENYKVLMEKLKVAKIAEQEQREKDRLIGIIHKKVPKKRSKQFIRGFTGLAGKFKDGVQTIPNRIIKATNRK